MRRIFLFVFVAYSVCSFAQLKGRLYLDREVFAPGEPVFLNFEITNTDRMAHVISQGDNYGQCSGFDIQLSSELPPGPSCAGGIISLDCLSSDYSLGPGENRIERLLLNFHHNISSPGEYRLKATRRVGFGGPDAGLGDLHESIEFSADLHFRVDKDTAADPAILNGLVRQLSSKDGLESYEAARILATIAPVSLEDTLLTFRHKSRFKSFAPLALHNLHTKRSLSELAEMLVHSEPGTYEAQESARYLAQTGDKQWFPLLQQKALESPNFFADFTAQLGGDEAVPFLLELMRKPDRKLAPAIAANALGQSGSRLAIPILLELLKSEQDLYTSESLRALRRLTHMTIEGEYWGKDPASQYPRWSRWWQQSQSTARIYKADECGEVSVLP